MRKGRHSGAGLKSPQAAVAKSYGGERCGESRDNIRLVRVGEANESKPSMTCRRIRLLGTSIDVATKLPTVGCQQENSSQLPALLRGWRIVG